MRFANNLATARVTVHFESIADKFKPYDSTFHTSNVEEVNETALSAACSLHTASATASSASSTYSYQKSNLDGITEDAEEDPAEAPAGAPVNDDSKSGPSHPIDTNRDDSSRTRQMAEAASADDTVTPTINGDPSTTPRPTTPVSQAQGKGAFDSPNIPNSLSIHPNYATSEVSLKRYDMQSQDDDLTAERRLSSQTVRPTQSEKYDFAPFGIKPKIKLGPRLFTDGRRPPSTTSAKSISTLPAGVRVASRSPEKSRSSTKPIKTISQQEKLAVPRSVISNFPVSEPPPVTSPARSTFSVKSSSSYSSSPAKLSSGVSREKQKLRKALELRRKQFQATSKANDALVDQQENVAEEALGLNNPSDNNQIVPATVVGDKDNIICNDASSSQVTEKRSDTSDGKGEPEIMANYSLKDAGSDATSQKEVSIPGTLTESDAEVKERKENGDKSSLEHNALPENPENPETPENEKAEMEHRSNSQSAVLHVIQPKSNGGTDVEEVTSKDSNTTNLAGNKENAVEVENAILVEKDLSNDTNGQLKADSGVGLLANTQMASEAAPKDSATEPNLSDMSEALSKAQEDKMKDEDPAPNAINAQTKESSPNHILPTVNQVTHAQNNPSEIGTYDRVRSNASFDLPLQGVSESVESGHIQHSSSGNKTIDNNNIGTVGTQDMVRRPESPQRQMQSVAEALPSAKNERRRSHRPSQEIIDVRRSGSQLQERRRSDLEPMVINVSPATSDADSFSDDSLIEELQSAEVQEAKPVSVSKSPINPFFNRRQSSNSVLSVGKRSVSATETSARPKDLNSAFPGSGKVGNGVRSFSASPKTKYEQTAVPKKVNVSSGISQRIKALTQLSGRTSPPPPGPTISKSPKAESSLISQRMGSFRSNASKTPVTPPNTAPTPKAVKRSSRISFTSRPSSPPSTAPASTPAKRSLFSRDMNASKIFSREANSSKIFSREANSSKIFSREANSSKIFSREANSSKVSISNLSMGKSKSESLSVTARIVRESLSSNQQKPPPPMATRLNSSHVELQKSQLTIQHHPDENQAVPLPAIPSVPMGAPSPTKSTSRPRSFQGALPRSSSESSWRQFRRRQSDTKATPPPSSSKSISNSSFDDEERGEEKRASRTSRLFKRMSSTISGSSRKGMTVLSPVVREEEQEYSESTAPASQAQIGDLNIQFPDTLVSFECSQI